MAKRLENYTNRRRRWGKPASLDNAPKRRLALRGPNRANCDHSFSSRSNCGILFLRMKLNHHPFRSIDPSREEKTKTQTATATDERKTNEARIRIGFVCLTACACRRNCPKGRGGPPESSVCPPSSSPVLFFIDPNHLKCVGNVLLKAHRIRFSSRLS